MIKSQSDDSNFGIDITKKNKLVESTYRTLENFFEKRGYVATPNLPLVTSDDSLYFTNSVIVRWKNDFIRGSVSKSYGRQSCLRLTHITNPIGTLEDKDRDFNRFLGFFNMAGAVVPPTEYEVFTRDISKLLVEKYRIDPLNIKIQSLSSMKFTKYFDEIFDLEYDTMPDDYYTWKFGLGDIIGRGATVCVEHPSKGFHEIGQIIEIRRGEDVLAYGFGFGIETFLSRRGITDGYDAWTIAQLTPEEYRFYGYLDKVSCFGALCTIPSSLFSKKHTKEVRTVAKKLVDTELYYNIPSSLTDRIIEQFVNSEFNGADIDTNTLDRLYKSRTNHQKKERKYKNLALIYKDSFTKDKLREFLDRRCGFEFLDPVKERILNEVYTEE